MNGIAMKKQRAALTVIVFLLRITSLLSLIGLISGFLLLAFIRIAGTGLQRSFDSVEFPLSNASNVIVDTDDRVLVNISNYGRVQIYDQSGQFVRGFFAFAPMEPSLIGFNRDDDIAVVAHRGNLIRVFSKLGAFEQEKPGGKKLKSEWEERPQWTRDSAGREYLVRYRGLNPQIVRRLPNDQETFLTTPFYLWPFVAPIPCLISIVLTQFVSNRLQRKI